MDRLVAMLRAAGDPTRLRLLLLLRQAIVDHRGTLLSQSTERTVDAESVPFLRGQR